MEKALDDDDDHDDDYWSFFSIILRISFYDFI